ALSGADYTGLGVYGATGRIFAFDGNHSQIAVFDSGAASPALTFDGSAAPTGAISITKFGTGLAVDQESGHVFVFDTSDHVVDEFKPGGQYVTQLTESLEVPLLPAGIAIDNSGGVNDGIIYVAAKSSVQAFAPLTHHLHLPYLTQSGFTNAC